MIKITHVKSPIEKHVADILAAEQTDLLSEKIKRIPKGAIKIKDGLWHVKYAALIFESDQLANTFLASLPTPLFFSESDLETLLHYVDEEARLFCLNLTFEEAQDVLLYGTEDWFQKKNLSADEVRVPFVLKDGYVVDLSHPRLHGLRLKSSPKNIHQMCVRTIQERLFSLKCLACKNAEDTLSQSIDELCKVYGTFIKKGMDTDLLLLCQWLYRFEDVTQDLEYS